jgi:DNA-binding NarL/FixJ family response regulator
VGLLLTRSRGAGGRAGGDGLDAVSDVRVLLVDDHVMFASSVAAALGVEEGITVVGTAPDLAAARSLLETDPVDVVLLDQRLPDGSGVGAIPDLKRLSPTTKVVMLTASTDDETLLEAMENGCSGFVEKSRTVDELVDAVRGAAAGEAVLSPALLSRLMNRVHRGAEPRLGADLTARELEVLGLVAEGLSNAAIAQRLWLSVNTVRNHVANVLGKLGVHSKLEALAVATREGLLEESRR